METRTFFMVLLVIKWQVNVTVTSTDILKHYVLQMTANKFAKCSGRSRIFQRGTNPWWVTNLLFDKFFPKNCIMKVTHSTSCQVKQRETRCTSNYLLQFQDSTNPRKILKYSKRCRKIRGQTSKRKMSLVVPKTIIQMYSSLKQSL